MCVCVEMEVKEQEGAIQGKEGNKLVWPQPMRDGVFRANFVQMDDKLSTVILCN